MFIDGLRVCQCLLWV